MKRTWTIFRILAALLVILLLGGCTVKQLAEPDRLGSWGQINQVIERPDDWEKLVEDSSFQLGEYETVTASELYGGTASSGEEQVLQYGTYPHLDGSTVCVPMAVEFARQHLGMSDLQASHFSAFNTTHTAYEALIYKTPMDSGTAPNGARMDRRQPVDVILVTEPSLEEWQTSQDAGVPLEVQPVCYDAFVFITHKDNPVDSLTVEQVRGIFSGKITNWSEVGGEDEEIRPYQREANSGSQTAMEQMVMQGEPMLPPETMEIVLGMGSLVEAVAEYQNGPSSIGYTFRYYIDTLYKNDNIKVLKINGIDSSPEQVQNGSYPFTANYYGVIRQEDAAGVAGQFLEWMLSDEGQACIAQAGYVPLRSVASGE